MNFDNFDQTIADNRVAEHIRDSLVPLQSLHERLTPKQIAKHETSILKQLWSIKRQLQSAAEMHRNSDETRRLAIQKNAVRKQHKQQVEHKTSDWAANNLNVGDIVRMTGTRDHGIRRVNKFDRASGDLVLEQLETFRPQNNKPTSFVWHNAPRIWSRFGVSHVVTVHTDAAAITTGNSRNITHVAKLRTAIAGHPDIFTLAFDSVLYWQVS